MMQDNIVKATAWQGDDELEATSGVSVLGITLERERTDKQRNETDVRIKVMLHKFLLWKTNKEQGGRYPAYIIYHTDYSSSSKEMIKRDMLYSIDEQQIRNLLAAEIAANVKKGWADV